MKKSRKLLAMLLVMSVIVSLVVVPASAEEIGFNISVVNFDADLTGENTKAANLSKMKSYISSAVSDGSDIIVFPEYALTSSTEDAITPKSDTAVSEISGLAQGYGSYILFGAMIEDNDNIYSAFIVCYPDGTIDWYSKTHLTDEEWQSGMSAGISPFVLSTPYGTFGLALGNEFADAAELGKYYYGAACRMVIVGQSYGYDSS